MDYNVTPVYKKNKNGKKYDTFEPVVSIITPYYNSKEYIEETALCVINQTFPWFEWIIVDDGSKDKNSIKKLDEISKMDNRIRIFHKDNEGLAATRDYGAKKSCESAKYLLFLDDDDLIDNNYLECLYYALETNETACFAYTNTVGFGEQNYLWDRKMDIRTEVKENILVATALIRKQDFFEVGGYGTKEKGINEDWIFWLKLFSKSKVPLKVNYYGFWYRRKKTGELKKSLNNIKKTTEYLNEYKHKVDYSITPIEYPKDVYSWDDVHRVENPFKILSKVTDKKTNIIMIMPHIVMGGADKFDIDFLKGLDEKYSVTILLTNISNNEWLSEIKKYCDSYYILPSFLDRKYWHLFIDYLIEKNDTKLLFNTNSIYGYMAIPYIKNKHNDIRIIDYVHMEEWYNRNGGFSRDSSAVGSCIDKTLVCNKASEDILVNYFGRKRKEVGTVYIGVDEKKFNNTYSTDELKKIKLKYNIPLDKKIITFICRIAEQKRPYLLAEIMKNYFQKYDDCVFLICGDGPLLEGLKEKVNKYKLDSALFLGKIKNTKEIYAISDCTLNCSIKEGLALTTYESLSMGVPVISSNVGGQSEIINDKVGVLVDLMQKEEDVSIYKYDVKEINSYVKAIRKVIDNVEEYKKHCRKRVLSGFTINSMNKTMNKIIDDILKSPNTKSFSNNDISLELLNQYLLETTNSFKGNINYFHSKYIPSKFDSKLKEKLYLIEDSINFKLGKISSKLHLYNEVRIIKNIVLCIIRIIYYIIKLIIVVIKHIFSAIKKIFNKLRGVR